MKDRLKEKFSQRQATVGVVGLGYVGLPLAVRFAEVGFRVIGQDISPQVVEKLSRRENYIPDVDDQLLRRVVDEGRLTATTEPSALAEADSVSICVPTPLSKSREPDMTYIMQALEALRPHLHPGMLLVLESTTYPGTTEDLIVPLVEEAGFKVGEEVFVAFSPERIDPGNPTFKVHNTPKVIGGVTPACTELAKTLYSQAIEQVVPVSTSRAAELVKLLENTFRNINIGWANEFALICRRLGVDVWEVIDAASTKPFGFMAFYPGPGLGGHCIPVDPHYLSWKLKTVGYTSRFISVADEINTEMPHHVVLLAMETLNRVKKPLKGSRILLVGAAYKRNIGDTRESPFFPLADGLKRRGAEIAYHDRLVPQIRLLDGEELTSVELVPEVLSQTDLVVIVTDHSYINWEELVSHAPLVLDTRNATRGITSSNIVRL